MKNINCLYERGSNCYALKKKECENCNFFIEDTEENRINYIDKVKDDIRKYALNHK